MNEIRRDRKGFANLEILLVVVIVAIIGFVGWYVLHAKNHANKNLGVTSLQASSGKSAPAAQKTTAGTDNQSLQNDLSGINSANGQSTKDLNTANSGLNDNSTFTSLPQ